MTARVAHAAASRIIAFSISASTLAIALVADQHERLRLVRQLTYRHIDQAADAPLELDVEWRKKGDAIIKNGGVAHNLNGVGFDDRQMLLY